MSENITGRGVRVWVVTGEYEEFPEAVAQIHASGALVVVSWGSNQSPIPLKGYAAGMWRTFEHQGDYTTPQPVADEQSAPEPPVGVRVAQSPDPVATVSAAGIRRRALPADRTYDRPKAEGGEPGEPQTAALPTRSRRRRLHFR